MVLKESDLQFSTYEYLKEAGILGFYPFISGANNATVIEFPKTIARDGKRYKVTYISVYADLAKCTKLEEVRIPKELISEVQVPNGVKVTFID